MISKVKTISQVYTLVAVDAIVGGQRGQDTQLNARSVSIFLNGSNDLHCTSRLALLVVSLNNLAKGTLTEEFDDRIWQDEED